MKIITCFAIILLLSGGGILLWQHQGSSQQPSPFEQQHLKNEKIVLEHYREDIETAKAKNKKEVVLPPAIQMPSNITSIEQIVRDYSLLRVKVKDREVTVFESSGDIQTWYKLEVLEALQQQAKASEESLVEGAPDRLLPLLPSESFLVMQGGTITADGIKIVRLFGSQEVALNLDQEYLVAAYLDNGGKLIRPVASAAGIFLIENSTLKPSTTKQSQLVREIEQRYGNDLPSLRSSIRSQRVQEQ